MSHPVHRPGTPDNGCDCCHPSVLVVFHGNNQNHLCRRHTTQLLHFPVRQKGEKQFFATSYISTFIMHKHSNMKITLLYPFGIESPTVHYQTHCWHICESPLCTIKIIIIIIIDIVDIVDGRTIQKWDSLCLWGIRMCMSGFLVGVRFLLIEKMV